VPDCLCCGEELKYEDYYGRNMHLDNFGFVKDGFEKTGDIYKCDNEECEMYGEYFYVLVGDYEVREGYPC